MDDTKTIPLVRLDSRFNKQLLQKFHELVSSVSRLQPQPAGPHSTHPPPLRVRQSDSTVERRSRSASASARRCAAERAAVTSGWSCKTPASSAASMRDCNAATTPAAGSSVLCSAVSRDCRAFSRRLASPTCSADDNRLVRRRTQHAQDRMHPSCGHAVRLV